MREGDGRPVTKLYVSMGNSVRVPAVTGTHAPGRGEGVEGLRGC